MKMLSLLSPFFDQIPERIKNVVDAVSFTTVVTTVVTSILGIISTVVTILAGIATLVWTILRIQDLLENRKAKNGNKRLD